jgi:hypothetical protein
VSDDQNRKTIQQWRHARIDRFIRRQRAVHEWINFGEVADFCAREAGSIAPNEVNRALAFEALADALIKGEFDRNGRPHVGAGHSTGTIVVYYCGVLRPRPYTKGHSN